MYSGGVCSVLVVVAGLLQLCSSASVLHEQLSAAELQQLFGVWQADDVPAYSVAAVQRHRHKRSADSSSAAVTIHTNDRQSYDIQLTPNSRLVSPHIVSYIRDDLAGNASSSRALFGRLPAPSDCHYTGTVTSHANASAAVSICKPDNERGTIVLDDHFLMFAPLPARLHDKAAGTHVVYKRSASLLNPDAYGRAPPLWNIRRHDQPLPPSQPKHKPVVEEQKRVLDWTADKHNGEQFCDSVNDSTNQTLVGSNGAPLRLAAEAQLDSIYVLPQLDPLTMEVALFMDSELFNHFRDQFGEERAESELVDFALALINHVHVLYQQSSMSPIIDLVLVRFEIWKTQPSSLVRDRHKNGQAQHLLNAFCSHQADINPGSDLTQPEHWDHAILLTGFDIYHTTSSVAGVAPVARMCDHQYSCSLVEGMHLGRSFVLAHEMGHNLGMVHDGVQNLCNRQCCLMSPVNGAGKTTWSPCSVRELNAYLTSLERRGKTRNCLKDSSIGLASHSHTEDKRLPGQRFTADEQCSYFWGRDFRQDIPVGRSMESICTILWCGNGGPTISTAHPALEGTYCAPGRWCRYGKCTAWPIGTLLSPVNGEWSSWSSASTGGTVCSECKIENGLRVRREYRRCDHPAPNNGGANCVGSAVRGLVCPPPLPGLPTQCLGFSNQLYGDRLCTAFKNDRLDPDRELDGTSYVHPDSPCKVWCQLASTQLIRNKAIFPDGTNCGRDKFCVNGECLSLACDGTALVDSATSDCPSSRSARASATWREWAPWSSCTSSCGQAVRNRHRLCTSASGQIKPNCPGAAKEQKECQQPACPEWHSWGQWSPCTASCGQHSVRARNRQCSALNACAGPSFESERCGVSECAAWSLWSVWSGCSASCNGGTRRRNRQCQGEQCDGHNQETNTCNQQACPGEWSDWSAWTECPAECGLQPQTHRKRLCLNGRHCPGDHKQTQDCPFIECTAEWSSWYPWSDCSVTCGQGLRQRSRICTNGPCIGPSTENIACNTQACESSWDAWTTWSPCTTECGGGTRQRTRSCSQGNCSGAATESGECNAFACAVWTPWDPWSECSVTCGSGLQHRRRSCRGNPDAVLLQSTSFSSRVTKCDGADSEMRICERGVCVTTTSTSTQIAMLSSASDPSPIQHVVTNGGDWTLWTTCSVTCGLGVRNRQRPCQLGEAACDVSLGIRQTRACHEPPCEVESSWAAWQLWSECSASCGSGRRRRVRVCVDGSLSCADGLESAQSEECNAQACVAGSWHDWQSWSQCSHSCGGGTKVRERRCAALDERQCAGVNKEQVRCSQQPCLLVHNVSSEQLVKTAPRKINGYLLPEWSEWSDWSKCSCFNRKQMRRRFCQVYEPKLAGFCLGPLIQQKSCVPGACDAISGGWSAWSSWSSCSAECGGSAYRVRNRMCSSPVQANHGSYCSGQSFEKAFCDQLPECTGRRQAGSWSEWTGFGECSASCGDGYKSRTRFCSSPAPENGGAGCGGADFDIATCTSDLFCQSQTLTLTVSPQQAASTDRTSAWGSWSDWTACTSSCGFSYQSRYRACRLGVCVGVAHMTRICDRPACASSLDGQWSAWSGWSRCNANCGVGQQARFTCSPPSFRTFIISTTLSRSCSNPSAGNGGLPCVGASTVSRACTPLRWAPCNTHINDEQTLADLHRAHNWET